MQREARVEKHEVEIRCGHAFEEFSAIRGNDFVKLTVFVRVFRKLCCQALASVCYFVNPRLSHLLPLYSSGIITVHAIEAVMALSLVDQYESTLDSILTNRILRKKTNVIATYVSSTNAGIR